MHIASRRILLLISHRIVTAYRIPGSIHLKNRSFYYSFPLIIISPLLKIIHQ